MKMSSMPASAMISPASARSIGVRFKPLEDEELGYLGLFDRPVELADRDLIADATAPAKIRPIARRPT